MTMQVIDLGRAPESINEVILKGRRQREREQQEKWRKHEEALPAEPIDALEDQRFIAGLRVNDRADILANRREIVSGRQIDHVGYGVLPHHVPPPDPRATAVLDKLLSSSSEQE